MLTDGLTARKRRRLRRARNLVRRFARQGGWRGEARAPDAFYLGWAGLIRRDPWRASYQLVVAIEIEMDDWPC